MDKKSVYETDLALTDFYNTLGDALNALMEKVDNLARAEEREQCALLCDELKTHEHTGEGDRYWLAAFDCAVYIRSRASDVRSPTQGEP